MASSARKTVSITEAHRAPPPDEVPPGRRARQPRAALVRPPPVPGLTDPRAAPVLPDLMEGDLLTELACENDALNKKDALTARKRAPARWGCANDALTEDVMAKRKAKKSRGKPLNSLTGRQAAMKRWAARRAADSRTAPTPEIAAPGRPGGAGGEFQAEYDRLRAEERRQEERERVAREAQAAQLEQERLDQAHQEAIDEDTERQRKAQEAIEEQHRQEEQARLDVAAARRVSSTPGPAGPVRPENKQGAYRKADYVKPDGVYKVVLPPGHVPGRKTSS